MAQGVEGLHRLDAVNGAFGSIPDQRPELGERCDRLGAAARGDYHLTLRGRGAGITIDTGAPAVEGIGRVGLLCLALALLGASGLSTILGEIRLYHQRIRLGGALHGFGQNSINDLKAHEPSARTVADPDWNEKFRRGMVRTAILLARPTAP